jgi:hypothetical protein
MSRWTVTVEGRCLGPKYFGRICKVAFLHRDTMQEAIEAMDAEPAVGETYTDLEQYKFEVTRKWIDQND